VALDALSGAGEPGLDSATAMITLGRILADRGSFADAERMIEQGLSIRRERLGPEHPNVKRAITELEEVQARRALQPIAPAAR
jgi:hypothetical protein